MLQEIRLPQLNVNDATATIFRWFCDDGAAVRTGDVLCTVETSKASADVVSPADGFVRVLCASGRETAVNAVIALLSPTLQSLPPVAKPSGPEVGDGMATEKAIAAARRLRIDINLIPRTHGIIREQDVLSFASRNFDVCTAPVPATFSGKLDDDFVRRIAADESFAALPGEKKLEQYAKHGAMIGAGVKLGERSLIITRYLALQEECEIGCDCYIRSECFSMGRMSILGNRANIVTRIVKIGDVLFSGNDILIGGGNAFSSQAFLTVGDCCLISSHCLLNTGNGIMIGNEVGLSPHVKLYTHNHWQNVLEGYRANFGCITLEDHCYITGDSLVVPGVTVGRGATVLANSTVTGNVPARTVVAGNPAKPVATVNSNLSIDQKERIVLRILEDMTAELTGRIPDRCLIYNRMIAFAEVVSGSVVLTFAAEGDAAQLAPGATVFDLSDYRVYGSQTRASDEVRNALRKHGIRFKPIYWRYRADVGLFNQ